MKKILFVISIGLIIIITCFSGCVSNDGGDNENAKNGGNGKNGEDETRFFIYNGTVTDSITNEPLENVYVGAKVIWIIYDYGRAPPPPTYIEYLGNTNTSKDGKYQLKIPVFENESADELHFELNFIKSGYFSRDHWFSDAGEKVMRRWYNASLDVKVKLSGLVTNITGKPIEDAFVAITLSNEVNIPVFNVRYLETTRKGMFGFNELNFNNKYDITIGVEGYQPQNFDNLEFKGHQDHIMNITLNLINKTSWNKTVNGTIIDWNNYINYPFEENTGYVWIFDSHQNNVEIINIDENGNFSVNLPEGTFYFMPCFYEVTYQYEIDEDKQPFKITENISIEIEIRIYYS